MEIYYSNIFPILDNYLPKLIKNDHLMNSNVKNQDIFLNAHGTNKS